MDKEFKTPMLQQYKKIKDNYPDCLLFFRLGDFYELFAEDAKIGAEVMNITLTNRSRGADGKIPMCGVPFHAAENYINKLVKAGLKVAIAEQTTEASDSKGLVEREVIRVVTPGTVLNEKLLEEKENNYILCINQKQKKLGFSFADLGTGSFYLHEIPFTSFEKELLVIIKQLQPKEVLLPAELYDNPHVLRVIKNQEESNIFLLDHWNGSESKAEKVITDHFQLKALGSFGFNASDYKIALPAASNLLVYLKETQKNNLPHITKLMPYSERDYLRLDAETVSNLELFRTIRSQSKKGSLLSLLDHSQTAMGGRLFRDWLQKPLANVDKIKDRLDTVELLVNESSLRAQLSSSLKEIIDIERLLSRLSVDLGTPRDLESLKLSLEHIKSLVQTSQSHELLKKRLVVSLVEEIDPFIQLIDKYILDDPPISTKEGGFIKSGISPELDELRELLSGDKQWLKNLEEQERKKTGIEKLKIDMNKVYGYYIEISKAQFHLVPDHYVRKQTLVNAERFIIPELKLRENQVFEAEDKIGKVEREIFEQLVAKILQSVSFLQQVARQVAELDCLVGLSELAIEQNYVKPEMRAAGDLEVIEGRHPVVESILIDTQFVPNDVVIRQKDSLLLLITGPNMSGKSTYLRQAALIVLMAQIGSFVPATKAIIPVVDQIFTRVGASDSLVEGQSTFLVEMIETANILNNATNRSLVVFDEVGRGTSTFDGMSIAWAVIEYLLSKKDKRPMTLFATHYHELTVLADKYPEIRNMQMAIAKEKDTIVFLRQVVDGAEWESYGIEVAKLAGLPKPVIKRAQEILYRLKANQKTLQVTAKKTKDDSGQMELI